MRVCANCDKPLKNMMEDEKAKNDLAVELGASSFSKLSDYAKEIAERFKLVYMCGCPVTSPMLLVEKKFWKNI